MKYISFLLYLLFSFIFISCNSDSPTTGGNNIPVDSSAFKYPFNNGSSWNYTYSISVTNIRPDSIKHYFSQYPVNGSGTTNILYDTTINSVQTKCFLDTYTENGTTFKHREYFINNDTAFIDYAYRMGSSTRFLPYSVNKQGIKLYSSGKSFRNLQEQLMYINYGIEDLPQSDSLVIFSPPRVSLKYPEVTGTQWTIAIFGTAMTITKKYTGFINIPVNGIPISCVKAQKTYSFLNNALGTDYVSKYGLIKKDFYVPDEMVSNEFGLTIGYIDWNETYQLTSYNIVNP